jgi:dihydrofolate synthase / folylpolyglutamate synthase
VLKGCQRPRTPSEAVELFLKLPPSTIRLGLERVHAALEALGRPERRYPVLHVAGTNGKGSTCAFAASVLHAQGYRVGLYTSPHLVRVNERIRIGPDEISNAQLGERLLEVIERFPAVLEDPPALTFFELGTVAAFWHFAQEKVDVAVIETGLGGRLDATNVVPSAVAAITAISFDHMEYLGHSLPMIAAEKAAIFKTHAHAVSSRQEPSVVEVLESAARAVGRPLYLEGLDFELKPSAPSGRLEYRGLRWNLPDVRLSLRGKHQRHNAAVALAALELLGQVLPVFPERALKGLSEAVWPGRLEELTGAPPLLLLDGAHNAASMQVLRDALDELYAGRPVHVVFGVLADKELDPMLRTLIPRCASVHLSPLGSPRSLPPTVYVDAVRALCPTVSIHSSVPDAILSARQKAEGLAIVLCTGSLFLVGEAKAWAHQAG